MRDRASAMGTGAQRRAARQGKRAARIFEAPKRKRAMHDVSTAVAIEFVEHSKRLRASHYRAEADRFKAMAETEPPELAARAQVLAATEASACVSSLVGNSPTPER